KHLCYLRRVNDHTQEELAERLGVSVGWVSRIERGVKVPNLPFLFRVGKVLHMPINELLPAERQRK
ncbi:MAG: helix-turn-helix domain-containing protein, partial [Ktedonobacteraceae bacterium]